MKKSICLIIAIAMIFSIAGCSAAGNAGGDKSAAQGNTDEKAVKVALILPGPINDGGWNATAYGGLMAAQEKFGVETNYSENVKQSDYEEVYRNYAESGFNIIFGHGFEFGDAAKIVAKEYPDTLFIVTGSNVTNGSNLIGVGMDTKQQGFISGALAAMVTKTGKVANIGGMDIPPIREVVEGVVAGAQYVDPNVKVLSALTGSFDDVNKAKEVALSMFDQGADIGFACANQAGLGLIEAAVDRNVMVIGCNTDQYDAAPENMVNSTIKDGNVMFTYVLEKYLDSGIKAFDGKACMLGVNEGCVYMAGWHDYDSKISDEIKTKLDSIIKGIGDGSIDYSSMIDKVDVK